LGFQLAPWTAGAFGSAAFTEEPEVAQLLMAPWDDEPVTEEEQAAVREALKEPSLPLERVRKELLG